MVSPFTTQTFPNLQHNNYTATMIRFQHAEWDIHYCQKPYNTALLYVHRVEIEVKTCTHYITLVSWISRTFGHQRCGWFMRLTLHPLEKRTSVSTGACWLYHPLLFLALWFAQLRQEKFLITINNLCTKCMGCGCCSKLYSQYRHVLSVCVGLYTMAMCYHIVTV